MRSINARAVQPHAVQRMAIQPAARQSPTGTSIALPPHLADFGAGRGTPIAPAVRQMMERAFATSFAAVTIHTGPHVRALGALAFTRGNEIHFAPGQYDPATPHGRHLLAHELAHVVQQRTGRVANPFGAGVAVVQNYALEAEAERLARRVTASTQTIQRSAAAQFTVTSFLNEGGRYVRAPADAEQLDVVRRTEVDLLARRPHQTLDWGLGPSRARLGALILELAGGGETYEVKLMQYLLGERHDVPSKVFGGLGSLSLSDEGRFSGRPGFVKGVFEESGGPGRHLRHETAHHTIQDVLNQIVMQFGVEALLDLAEDAEPYVLPEVDEQVTHWILRHGQFSKTEFRLLWLASVLNNIKSNLWMGPGRENISINSFCSALKGWNDDLDSGRMTIDELLFKLRSSGVSSTKGREAAALAIAIITAANAKAHLDHQGKVTEIVNEIFRRCIMPLEVDVKKGAVMNPASEQLFMIANGVGDLGQAFAALRSFMGIRD